MKEQTQLKYFKKKIRRGAKSIWDIYPHWMGWEHEEELFHQAVKEIQEEKDRRRMVLEERMRTSDKISDKISAVVLAVGIPVVAIFHYFDLF